MPPGDLAHEQTLCDNALERAFGFLGKRWNGVIIGALVAGPAGFAQLARTVTGISDSVLSERLAGLGRGGLVVRRVEPGPPVTVSYELSSAGRALVPALAELSRWAEQHVPTDGPCVGTDPCSE